VKTRRNLLILSAACMVIAGRAAQSQHGTDWQTAAGGKMAFEVASVKESQMFKPPTFPMGFDNAYVPGGTFSASLPLYVYVGFAYKLPAHQLDKLVSQAHLPAWVRDGPPFFAIEARAAGRPTKDQMRLMMQALLADRFKLAAHFESTEGPVFALTLVKPGRTGPKLRPHSQGPPCPESSSFSIPSPRQIRDGEVFPTTCGSAVNGMGPGGARLVGFRDSTMTQLADSIYANGSMAGELDKPVVDQTGLAGTFDFTIEWMPGESDRLVRSRPPGSDAPKEIQPGTSFVAAVREQLGLKLVPSRGPIQSLVIDHIEKLSAN
jgi:bla regulator protein BlaR1